MENLDISVALSKTDAYHTMCECCANISNISYTPRGADYHTCPICGDRTENMCEANNACTVCNDASYCNKCNIIFDVGCTHACNGCTEDCHNGHIVSSWKDIEKNIIYDGMPVFKSFDAFLTDHDKFQILSWLCINDGKHCSRGYYPKESHPQYYRDCSLKK
jgi:hypothetical protein